MTMGHSQWSIVLPCLLVLLMARALAKVRCPLDCTCSPQRVHCQGDLKIKTGTPPYLPANDTQKLTAIPHLPSNNTVTSLVITNMNIQRITVSDFSSFVLLQKLDLTQNNIEMLADGAFQSLTVLESLVIRNNFLRELSDDMFMGLVRLKALDVSGNRLVELSSRSFLPLKNLEMLNLAANEIEHIQDEAFFGLYRLHTLILTGNRLMDVNGNYFEPLNALENLMLDNCSIRFIDFHSFSPLVRLKRLSLAYNKKLSFLLVEIFVSKSQPILEDLSIRGTGIKEVPVAALRTLTQLKTLDLSQTLVPVIRKLSFTNLENLNNLTLDSLPRLHRLETDAFFGLHNLQYLSITNNKLLNNISDGAFRNLSSLRYLDLHNNDMETFQTGLADWQSIEVVDLRGNPLHCDCKAVWMLTSLDGHRNKSRTAISKDAVKKTCSKASATKLGDNTDFSTETLAQMITCHTPSHLTGRCLMSLTPEDLCSNRSASHMLNLGLPAAGICFVLLLLCWLLLKFRRRLCRRGYPYQMHNNRGGSRQSSLVDVMEMETTQVEELPESDLDS